MARFVTFGYSGGGRLYDGPDREAAIEAARAWASEQDAGAAVRDAETGEQVFAQVGAE